MDVPSDTSLIGNADSTIIFKNSQGHEARGTLLRLSRYSAAFEVYNPYSILQLSEVLSDFRIWMGERPVYNGRAVVSSLVNAGNLVVCETTLDESWLEVDIFSPINQPGRLRRDFAEFLKGWERMHAIRPDYKAAVADVQAFFVDVRRWLEQVELGIRSQPTGDRAAMERDVIGELGEQVHAPVSDLFQKFETVSQAVESELQPLHRTYVKRQLHPYLLCSPFAYRTYYKPLGYAGDYEMVNMILRDPHEGSSLFAKMVNVWLLNQPVAQAHRNRVRYLKRRLTEETARVAGQGRQARILNLGCGPAGEIQEFLAQDEISNWADFRLLDFNDETLRYAEGRLTDLRQRHHRDAVLAFEKRSVHQLLKDCARRVTGNYDFIYCAGLFDYLSDRVCRRLTTMFYDMLAPGGLLITTNVSSANPVRTGMAFILEWNLVYRDDQQMLQLIPDGAPPNQCLIQADATNVNLFLEVRKPYEV